MTQPRRITRRRFAQAAAAVAAAPMFVPKRAFGANDKVALGCIGIGWQGSTDMARLQKTGLCQVVAVCDLDKNHLNTAKNTVDRWNSNKDCKAYHDFRELLARKDVDAVLIATPDHWHSIPAIAAAKAGKDIYCEKPLAHSLIEGVDMVKAVEGANRIWQTGSWQRSVFNFREGVELVFNGHIGKVTHVEVGLPSGHTDFEHSGKPDTAKNGNPPAELDYDFWIGPSQMMPYNPAISHKNWRWNYNTGGGQCMDWIGHHLDIAHWGLSDPEYGIESDAKIGPEEVTAKFDFPPHDDLWNTAGTYRIDCKYPGGVQVTIASDNTHGIRRGTKWIGPDGWVYVDRGGFDASNKEWTKNKFDRGPKKAYFSNNHWQNFLECVKSRKPTITPVAVANRSVAPGHIGIVAAKLGKTLKWDREKQVVTNSDEANALLSLQGSETPWMPFRKPWTLG